jgi:transketolase
MGRDRFVLSNGHGCALLYSMLHLTGYPGMTMEELKQFRQLGSHTPGHPEAHLTPGVEVSTGPLGQGITNAVGLAIGEAHMRATYNRPGHEVFGNYTYVICGDGCLQEGISAEAGSLAGHLGLGRLIVMWDNNHITIDGETSLAFTEDVLKRYEAYGWHVQEVEHGNEDYDAIERALKAAKAVTDKPSIISVKTTIGFGSAKQDTDKVHGSPLGAEDIANVKAKFGFDPAQSFHVPEDVGAFYRAFEKRGHELAAEHAQRFAAYAAAFPKEAAEVTRRMRGELPEGWQKALPSFAEGNKDATRKSGETVLQALAAVLPELMGGSADLNPSTFTYIKASGDYQSATPEGRNIRFGVREHAMASVCNGLAAYGGYLPYCSTFLTFVGYAYGAVRLSALSAVRVVYIMTHDSIGLGEDGPTHQPVEVISLLRSTPNMLVLRPGDANEVVGAYAAAVSQKHRPSTLCLSRQATPAVHGTSPDKVRLGAYVISDPPAGAAAAKVVLVATGSELGLAAAAAAQLAAELPCRVVSFPSWELFEEQPEDYKRSVFPRGTPVLSVEAATTFGWSRYAHAHVGMTTFGASAPDKKLFEHFGFTASNVANKAKALVAHFGANPAPELNIKL